MIMDVCLVNMSAYDKGMVAFGETPRQLVAQAVSFFRGDLSGDKGLPYLIRNHIISSPLSAGLGEVLPFCKMKLSIGNPAVALIAGDEPAAVRLFRVLYIANNVTDRCPHGPALAGVQGHDTGGGDKTTSFVTCDKK